MTSLTRLLIFSILVVPSLAMAQEGVGQSDLKPGGTTTIVDDAVTMTQQSWWLAVLFATVVLAWAIGLAVYRSKVKNNRASSATGCGCLVAVIMFLLAQTLVAAVFLTTTMSRGEEGNAGNAQQSTDNPVSPPAADDADPYTSNEGDDF